MTHRDCGSYDLPSLFSGYEAGNMKMNNTLKQIVYGKHGLECPGL